MVKKKLNISEKYYFFLNPYDDCGFYRCPKCEGLTRVRKFLLVINIKNSKYIFNLNKQCKFCSYCELIISKKSDVDDFLTQMNLTYSFNKNDYCIIGTLSKDYLKKCKGKNLLDNNTKEIFKKYFRIFKKILNFEQDYDNRRG